MFKQVAKSSVQLIIIIMILECFMACFVSHGSRDSTHLSFREKAFSSVLMSLLAQGEEEKSEKEGDKSFAELADYTQITFFLSSIHTPCKHRIVFEHPDNYHLPLFKLFRTFII